MPSRIEQKLDRLASRYLKKGGIGSQRALYDTLVRLARTCVKKKFFDVPQHVMESICHEAASDIIMQLSEDKSIPSWYWYVFGVVRNIGSDQMKDFLYRPTQPLEDIQEEGINLPTAHDQISAEYLAHISMSMTAAVRRVRKILNSSGYQGFKAILLQRLIIDSCRGKEYEDLIPGHVRTRIRLLSGWINEEADAFISRLQSS